MNGRPHPNEGELRELKESALHLQSAFAAMLRVIQRLEQVPTHRSQPVVRPTPKRVQPPPTQPPPPRDAIPSFGPDELPTSPGRRKVESKLAPRGAKSLARRPSHESVVEFLIGDKWLRRVGTLIFLVGIGFLISYAYDEGWLLPGVLVGSFCALGLLMLVTAEVCVLLKHRSSAILSAASGGLVIHSVIAWGQAMHALLPPEAALAIHAGAAILLAGICAHGRFLVIAHIAALCAAAAPSFGAWQTGITVTLVGYAVLTQGVVLAISAWRGWNTPRLSCWIGLFGLLLLAFVGKAPEWPTWVSLACLACIYAIFHAESLATFRGTDELLPWMPTTVLHLNNIALFTASVFIAREASTVALTAFCIAATLSQWIAAGRIKRLDRPARMIRRALRLDGAVFLAFLPALLLDGYGVTIAWCIQAVLTAWLCRRLFGPVPALYAAGIAVAAMAHVVAVDFFDPTLTETWTLLHGFDYTWVTLLTVLAASAGLLVAVLVVGGRTTGPWEKRIGATLCFLAAGLVLAMAAHQSDRYYATWWWIALAAIWCLAAYRFPVASLGGVVLITAAAIKFLLWDTVLVLLDEELPDIQAIGFNRAVYTGILLSGLLALGCSVVRRMPPALARRYRATTWGLAFTVTALLAFTWTGTFEIIRVFSDEELRLRFNQPDFTLNAAISILWAACATIFLIIGLIRMNQVLRLASIVLFGLTLAKLLLIDLAYVETGYRIVLFIGLGGLMLLASLLYHRLSARVLGAAPRA